MFSINSTKQTKEKTKREIYLIKVTFLWKKNTKTNNLYIIELPSEIQSRLNRFGGSIVHESEFRFGASTHTKMHRTYGLAHRFCVWGQLVRVYDKISFHIERSQRTKVEFLSPKKVTVWIQVWFNQHTPYASKKSLEKVFFFHLRFFFLVE